jgi:hypothetical protein
LVNHARAILIMRECKNTSISNLNKHIQEYEKSIKKKYSIRSNITVWLSNCLEKERVRNLIFLIEYIGFYRY